MTYNRGLVVSQSNEDISDSKGLRDVAMATKFCPKYTTNLTKMVISSVGCDTSTESLVLKLNRIPPMGYRLAP